MKARLDGEDWNGLDATIKEFSRLTPRDQFAERLTKLKDDAAHQQAELKKAILTKTAQAQISDLQSMIDRYLDDETYKAYADALERAHADLVAKDKAKTKKAAVAATQKKAAAAKAVPPPAARGMRPPVPQGKAAPPPSSVPF